MKNIITILLFISLLSCKAQVNTIPIENEIIYRNNETEVADDTYWKDVNNLFDKFIGTWVGTYNNKNYEFVVSKYTYNSTIRPLTRDELIIKYKITDNNGNIIVNTLNVPDDDMLVIEGDYLDENGETYHLDYTGENFVCGQNGYVLIAVINNGLNMNFRYAVKGQMTDGCTTGPAVQVLPSAIQLVKQ